MTRKEDLYILREQFIKKYSISKGWNYESLTTSQMMEIVMRTEYISPKYNTR